MGRPGAGARIALLVGLLSALPARPSQDAVLAQDGRGRASLAAGIFYSSGHYGAPTTTEVLYVPLIARYETDDYALGLTVPYLSITGNGERVDGEVFFDSRSSERITSAGLGDVIAAASYTLYRGKEPRPWVDLTGVVKFGTADRKQELGTGENDYAAQFDAYQRAGRLSWFTSLGYKVPGSPPGIRLGPVTYGSAGGRYAFTYEHSAGAMWSGQEALPYSSYPQSEAILFYGWVLSPRYKMQFFTSRGLTPGSPDWSVGTTLARSF